jgi:hypothetical protein
VDDELAGRRVTGEDDSGPGLGDRREHAAGDRQLLRLVGRQHPAPLDRDADGHHVVRVPVDRGQHAAGRHAGHGVLAAAAAEHDGDARLARLLGHRAAPYRRAAPGPRCHTAGHE